MKRIFLNALSMFLLMSLYGSFAQSQEPWGRWSRNPLSIPVSVDVSDVYAETNTTVEVTLADARVVIDGYNCGLPTNRAFNAGLSVRREYVLTVAASNLTSLNIHFSYQPTWNVGGRRGKAQKPKDYKLLVDRSLRPDNSISFNNPNGYCTGITNTWTIELTERLPANWRLDDGSDNAEAAPGNGDVPTLGPGKSVTNSVAALSWSVSLGRLMDGKAAGRLSVREAMLSREIYTPTNIYLLSPSEIARDQVELITLNTNSPVLRQVKAYQTFVDIVALTNSTELRFYLPSQIAADTNTFGHYTNIAGSPFVVWELANPEPATTNNLNIVERRNGVNSTNQFTFDPNSTTATWTLMYGTNSEQRVENRGVVISTGGGETNRTETVDIRYSGASFPAYRAVEKYKLFSWGFELIEVRVDPDNNSGTANDLVTSFTFYADTNYLHSYGKPNTMTSPDGYYEKRLYDDRWYLFGALRYVLRPDRDSPANPDDATCENSIFTETTFFNDGNIWDISQTKTCYKDSSEWLRTDLTTHELWYNDLNHSFIGAQIDMGTAVADTTFKFNEEWGFGYFGHAAYAYDEVTTRQSTYVNGGTYDSATKIFTISTNDVWAGPDFREAVIHYERIGERDTSELPEPASLETIDGQTLFGASGDSGAYPLYPHRCWRESFIYQTGSLVQREMHVFTGMDGTNAVFEPVCKWVYKNDSLGHATNIVWIDSATSVTRTVFEADYRGANTFDGNLALWQVDETGVRTDFVYDSQKRLVRQVKQGVSASGSFPSQTGITNTISYDAFGRTLTNATSSGDLGLMTVATYDVAGRLSSEMDTNGLVTTYAYDLGGRRVTKTLPSGATQITENYLDQRLKSVSGTGVVTNYHNWEYRSDIAEAPVSDDLRTWGGVATYHLIRSGPTNSARVRTEGIDEAGRVVRWETPDPYLTNCITKAIRYRDYTGTHSKTKLLYDSRAVFADAPIITQTLDYDYDSSTNTVIVPVSSPYGGYRLTRMDKTFVKVGGHWYETVTNTIYRTFGDTTPTLAGITLERLNGFASSSVVSENKTWDADTNLTVITTYIDRAAKKVTEVRDTAQSTLNATNIIINGLLQWESTPTVSAPTRHYYDALGRQTSVVNPLGFTATIAHNQFGQVTNTTDFTGQATSYEYYANGQTGAGQVKCITTGGKKTWNSYTARGELHRKWGDVPYPEERLYSDYGELVELRTFRGGTGWNGSSWPVSPGSYDKTTWTYEDWSGLLSSKIDHQNHSVSYTYRNGLLHTKAWSRGITVTYRYNSLGELVGMDYSDGTPSVSYTSGDFLAFSRTGRPLTIVDDSGAWVLSYDHADRLTSATCTNGLLDGITVSNHFSALYGRDFLRVEGISPELQHDYTYDTQGRLGGAASGVYSATYGYLPDSDLLQTTTFKNNDTTKLTTTRSWEYGSRLSAILNTADNTTISSHGYTYDGLNRRTRASLEDGSYWQYDYNDRNELTGAKRYWQDTTPVSGQHFGYDYDNIGNRESAWSGGDTTGANLRETTYTVNSLNQYTSIVTPGYEDIMGLGFATNVVTVNGGAADRKVEYFHQEITVANSSNPVWTDVTVDSGGTTNAGGFVFPKNSAALTYDLDGNLTFDGVWSYEWDGENRLKAMTMTNVSGIPAAQREKLEFAYDYMNRRVKKVVSTWNGSSFDNAVTTKFVYDGWNLLAELDASDNALRSYLWGLDLSGTMHEAGGIGGLLLVTSHSSPVTNSFVCFDGNGNITALVNASDQSVTARYEYSAYGELLRSTGPLAVANPFRWSSKFWDEESGLVYYGYRYLSPVQGRWLGRDPIEEEGGVNLFAFASNDPINAFDPVGQNTLPEEEVTMEQGTAIDANTGASAVRMLNRVRDWADRMNDFQEIFNLVLDAADGDATDLLTKLWDARREIASLNKGAQKAEAQHHVFTQKFGTWMNKAGIDTDKFTVGLSKVIHTKLHSGKGFGRGGMWNWLWKKYTGGKAPDKMNPDDIKAFERQVSKFFGIDDRPVVPY